MAESQIDPIYARTFPGGHRKGDQMRFEIISATISLLAKHGPDGLAFDRIGKAMGTRRSHIIYYFKSKEDLLNDILKYITATAQEITIQEVQKATSMKGRLLAIADGAIEWAERFPDQLKVMILFYFIFSYDEDFKQFHTEVRALGRQRLQGVLQNIFSDRPEKMKQVASLAQSLQGVITGLLIEKASVNRSENTNYRQIFHDLCQALID